MRAFRAEHAERAHAFTVDRPLAEALRLFEPEGERLWAAGWEPRYLNPEDGVAARGMVFTTGHGGEDTVWMLVRHEPAQGLVEYVRVTPGSRIGRVLVQCSRLEAARTRVNVVYAFTALTESGNAYVRAMDAARFSDFIESWSVAIAKALSPGG